MALVSSSPPISTTGRLNCEPRGTPSRRETQPTRPAAPIRRSRVLPSLPRALVPNPPVNAPRADAYPTAVAACDRGRRDHHGQRHHARRRRTFRLSRRTREPVTRLQADAVPARERSIMKIVQSRRIASSQEADRCPQQLPATAPIWSTNWKARFPAPFLQADDGSRTRDLRLGKPTLYQLSYVRAEAILGRGQRGVTHRARSGRPFGGCATSSPLGGRVGSERHVRRHPRSLCRPHTGAGL